MRKHLLILLMIATGLVGTRAWADSTVLPAASRQDPLSSTGGTARAIAMGSAFVGVADDASAILWNPAGLSSMEDSQISLHHVSLLSQAFQEVLIFGVPLKGLGGLGLTANYVGYGNFDGRDALGFSTSSYSANQMGLGLGWGLKILGDLSAGAALYGTQQTLAGNNYLQATGALGLLWRNREGWGAGLAAQNLGPAPSAGNITASSLRLGLSRQWASQGSLSLLTAASGDLEPQGGNSLQAGLEAGYHSVLFVRAGYDLPLQDTGYTGLQGLTAGVGVRLESFRLDYAFVPYGELGATQNISLGYFFGGAAPSAVQKQQASSASGPMTFVVAPVKGVPAPQALPQQTPEALDAAQAPPSERTITMEFEVPAGNGVSEAKTLDDQGRWQEALQVLANSVKKDPTDEQAWREMGNIYYAHQYKDYAVTCFQQVLKLKPDDKALSDWLEQYKSK